MNKVTITKNGDSYILTFEDDYTGTTERQALTQDEAVKLRDALNNLVLPTNWGGGGPGGPGEVIVRSAEVISNNKPAKVQGEDFAFEPSPRTIDINDTLDFDYTDWMGTIIDLPSKY